MTRIVHIVRVGFGRSLAVVTVIATASTALAAGAAGGEQTSASVASSGGSLTSGTYRFVGGSGPNVYVGKWVLKVSGGSVTGTSYWTCCPGARVDPLSGTTGGGKVTITRDCRGQGQTLCVSQTFTGTISATGKVAGTWVGNANLSGTWSMTATAPPASLSVAVSAPTGLDAVRVGEVFAVTVKVTASGGDFKDVFLTNGGVVVKPACYGSKKRPRTSSGHSVVVTFAPPGASGFPLGEGETRTFEFKARGHDGGPSTLSVSAHGTTPGGDTALASDSAVVSVEYPISHNAPPVVEISGHFCTSGQPVNPPGP